MEWWQDAKGRPYYQQRVSSLWRRWNIDMYFILVTIGKIINSISPHFNSGGAKDQWNEN